MPRSNEKRSKGENVREEFPFLDKIISLKHLEMIRTDTKFGGFLVRRVKYDFLFGKTSEEGSARMETWIAYTSPSVDPNHAERLPSGKELWEVFPYGNEKPGLLADRKFIAVVHVLWGHQDEPYLIIVFKLPKDGTTDWRAFESCLENIRRVSGWPSWKVYNHEPNKGNNK